MTSQENPEQKVPTVSLDEEDLHLPPAIHDPSAVIVPTKNLGPSGDLGEKQGLDVGV